VTHHCGQIVAVQVALAALAGAAIAGTPGAWLVATAAAGALLGLGLGRLRHRPLYAWCVTALRYASRTRRLAPGAGPAALLALVEPTALTGEVDLGGERVGVVEDAAGLTAVLELGDTAGLLGEATLLPAPADLLPAPVPETPSMCVQLLVTGVPAPALRVAAGLPATSYRHLTEGRVPAGLRALLAVRANRDDPGWTDVDLRPPLVGAVRRIRRRFAQEGVPAHALDAGALERALADLAHHDPAVAMRESWTGLRGDLHQASVLLRRRPDRRDEGAGQLLPRLLGLPTTAVTAALTAGPRGGQLVVRLAAPSAAALAAAGMTLRRVLAASGATGIRLDGEQRDGLAATLPLARSAGPGGRARHRRRYPRPASWWGGIGTAGRSRYT
jgi:type VII secretion protein EccE